MPQKIAVAIPTHNPRMDYLRRVLESLQQQSLPCDEWELIVVDNCSKEPLSEALDLSWHPHARTVREETLGLTPARLRAFKECACDLIVMVDDDNILAPDYLREALGIARIHGGLGVFGAAKLIPEFETSVPTEILAHTHFLALRDSDEASWGSANTNANHPFGAGLVLRRAVFESYLSELAANPIRAQLDRTGDLLLSYGDIDILHCARNLKYGHGIFPELSIIHLIPGRRTNPDYLLKIARGHAFSQAAYQRMAGIVPTRHAITMRNSMIHLVNRRFAYGLRMGLKAVTFTLRGGFDNQLRKATARGESDGMKIDIEDFHKSSTIEGFRI